MSEQTASAFASEIVLWHGGAQFLAHNGLVSFAILYDGRALLATLTPDEARTIADHLSRAAASADIRP